MVLYYTARSPYARKVRMVAYEKQVYEDIQFVDVDLGNKPADFLAKNPLGKIPALVLEKGRVLFESNTITEYLDTIGSGPSLYVTSYGDRIDTLNLIFLANGLMDVCVDCFKESMRPEALRSEAHIQRYQATILRTLQCVDRMSTVFSETFDMVAIAWVSAVGYLDFRFPHLRWQDGCPRLAGWVATFQNRDSVRLTAPIA